MERSHLVLNEEKRKQGNKKEKLTESLQLTVKIANFASTKSLPKPQSGSK